MKGALGMPGHLVAIHLDKENDMQTEYRKAKLTFTAEVTLRPENYKYDERGNVRDGWEDLTPEEMVQLELDLIIDEHNGVEDYIDGLDENNVKIELISDETSCSV